MKKTISFFLFFVVSNLFCLFLLNAQITNPIVSALNNKTNLCSNGTDFASLVVSISNVPETSIISYQWKKTV